MRPVSSSSIYLWKYGRYLHGNLSLVEFCKTEGIDYLEFTEWINRWEERYGSGMVEDCMKQPEYNAGFRMPPERRPSHAQKLFGEILVVPDEEDCRSRKRFPKGQPILADLSPARPGDIVRQASITFPGGAVLEFQETTLKSLILTVVLYEDFDTWAGE